MAPIAHKMRNLLAKLPKDEAIRKEIMPRINTIYYALDRQTADALSAKFIEEYARRYPAMTACFSDDLEACLTHLSFPIGHRKFIRTTNLIERAFEEEKRRTKIIPQHVNERGAVKLVFGVLLRASNRWVRVSMTELELVQLRNLRPMKTQSTNNSYSSYRLAA
jgi:putative transposase